MRSIMIRFYIKNYICQYYSIDCDSGIEMHQGLARKQPIISGFVVFPIITKGTERMHSVIA